MEMYSPWASFRYTTKLYCTLEAGNYHNSDMRWRWSTYFRCHHQGISPHCFWDVEWRVAQSTLTVTYHVSPFILSIVLAVCRSLVEDDDAHMKVSLGCGEMGLSAHLQASKMGNTRFFTSNTHSSVVLQVSVCVRERSWICGDSGSYSVYHDWSYISREFALCVCFF